MACLESLEQRLLPTATITPVFETEDFFDFFDPAPVINDSGTVVFIRPSIVFDANHQSRDKLTWMSNGGELPGLVGYVGDGGPKNQIPNPDLNNSQFLALVQYRDIDLSEQELVIYDVRHGQRVTTITTGGEFKSFKDVEINDAGYVAVIAEKDDGTGGIYYLEPGSNTLEPALTYPGLATNIDRLKLLNDSRSVFRANEDDYFTTDIVGNTELYFGDGKSGDIAVSVFNLDRIRRNGVLMARVTVNRSSDFWNLVNPCTVQLTIREHTANSASIVGNQQVIIPANQSSVTVEVPITDSTTIAALSAEISLITDPFRSPTHYVSTDLDVIQRRPIGGWGDSTRTLQEPADGQLDTSITLTSSDLPSRQPTEALTGSYKITSLTATDEDVVLSSGTFTVPANVFSATIPITLLSDNSSLLTQEDVVHFLVTYTVRNDTTGQVTDTYSILVKINDADYLGGSIARSTRPAINGLGDIAFLPNQFESELLVVSNNQIIQHYPGQSNIDIDLIKLSDQREVVLGGNIGSDYALFRLESSVLSPILTEDDPLVSGHIFKGTDFTASNDFQLDQMSISSSGNVVFYSRYSIGSDTSTAGYGIYSISEETSTLPDLVVTDFSYKVAPKTNKQVNGPVPRGSTLLVTAKISATGVGTAQDFDVDLYYRTNDGEEIRVGTVAHLTGINANQRLTLSKQEVVLTNDLPAKAGTLFCRVDRQNSVTESNEQNNDSSGVAISIGALGPGIYVGGREVPILGLPSPGTHQYVLVIPKTPKGATVDLGDGTQAYILGAYKDLVAGTLIPDRNRDADVSATKEFVDPDLFGDNGGHWNTHIAQVNLGSLKLTAAAKKLNLAFEAYRTATAINPIEYPSDAFTLIAATWLSLGVQENADEAGELDRNSNSWAQSIIEYTFGAGAVQEDFPGLDVWFWNRIPPIYFRKRAN